MSTSGLLFGLNVSSAVAAGRSPVDDARAAEDLGFDFVSASDHPCGTEPVYETWTMLCWIAASTQRLRLATRVLGVPYRNPALVAKMAETLDRLSGGRLILGLGGGSADEEFRAFGLGVPSAREKIDGLEDAVQIARGLWSKPGFTFHGHHYHTERADLEPKPDHAIPVWLGTFGPRALELTGRLADGWIPTYGYAPPEQLPGMRERVLAAAEKAGRDPGEITCALHMQASIDDDAETTSSMVAGPPTAVAAQLLSFVKLGFTAFNLTLTGQRTGEQAERFATEVIPAVRAAAMSD